MEAYLEEVIFTDQGQVALGHAAGEGQLEMVKYIAENGGSDMMDGEDEGELKPIHFASLEGRLDVVRSWSRNATSKSTQLMRRVGPRFTTPVCLTITLRWSTIL